MDESSTTGVLGASSFVGECVIRRLRESGRQIVAFSRSAHAGNAESTVTWLQLLPSVAVSPQVPHITEWVCVAPIWVLSQYFSMMEASDARRVVVLSSTSLFAKKDSPDPDEQALVCGLHAGEQALRTWAETQGVEWVILRPTLIYGYGRDKNVTEILRFVRRWGGFPLLGRADGLRQPVHAEDVAMACVSALTVPAAGNRAYNLSGGETLSYREMVCRIFAAIGKRPQAVTIPRWLFRLAVAALRRLPRYRNWTTEMAERMNRDLVFDHGDAARDLGFSPRPFHLSQGDMPT
ncbi:MAG: NAD-dependent epimerase/dehydratase family protein [Nitrospira sp.]|uniref:NAD-dependent epimerase/dehydratase family protein n=1 Tax=Nitrospira sp. BLG_1 TaxID=3395883 RepID=UPI001DF64147|nr:NAD-dependent epimerase/dehydratase family protein [Nitrospira sp.]MBX3347946.1 NAD-dependent epimerase/dehydratase family protein [Nitrospira sp.]